MDEFEVTVFKKGVGWDGKRAVVRKATDAKAAAEAVLKRPLSIVGQSRDLRATVWRRGDPGNKVRSYYAVDPD